MSKRKFILVSILGIVVGVPTLCLFFKLFFYGLSGLFRVVEHIVDIFY